MVGILWARIVPLCAVVIAVAGCFLRGAYSMPFLHGTWLASAISQLMKPDQAASSGVNLMSLWAWVAILGSSASLWVISVSPWSPDKGWRLVRILSIVTVPSLVATAVPLFALPLIAFVPIGICVAPMGACASLASLIVILRQKLSPTMEGLLAIYQMLSYSFLALVVLDWLSILLFGVT